MTKTLYVLLSVLLGCGVLLGVALQTVVFPGAAQAEVDLWPPYAPFQAPLVFAAIAFVVCVQVALVAVWALLTRTVSGTFFLPESRRWVTLIIGAVAVALVLVVGVLAYLLIADVPVPESAGMSWLLLPLGGLGGILVGGGILALCVVGRSLLSRAIDHRLELDEVI